MFYEPNHNVTAADIQHNPPNWGLVRIMEHHASDKASAYAYPPTAGAGVDVYVLDTGIAADHAQLSNHVSLGPNFSPTGTGSDDDLSSWDDNGHGTFIAGIVAGKDVGVAKQAHVVSVKILDLHKRAQITHVLQGLDWVYRRHAQVPNAKSIVNLSIDSIKSETLNEALQQCTEAGILVVAAAGNGNSQQQPLDACTRSPGSFNNGLVVGAMDQDDKLATFTNQGECVHIYAPGVNVKSAKYQSNDLVVDQGTSYACPFVTGVAAVIMSNATASKDLPMQVRNWIMQNATMNALSIDASNSIKSTQNRALYAGGWAPIEHSIGMVVVAGRWWWWLMMMVVVMQ